MGSLKLMENEACLLIALQLPRLFIPFMRVSIFSKVEVDVSTAMQPALCRISSVLLGSRDQINLPNVRLNIGDL